MLILDEPTSSLTANEVESLFRIMRELKEQGVALVYISHKMDEIKVIADEVPSCVMVIISASGTSQYDQRADHRQDGRP